MSHRKVAFSSDVSDPSRLVDAENFVQEHLSKVRSYYNTRIRELEAALLKAQDDLEQTRLRRFPLDHAPPQSTYKNDPSTSPKDTNSSGNLRFNPLGLQLLSDSTQTVAAPSPSLLHLAPGKSFVASVRQQLIQQGAQ